MIDQDTFIRLTERFVQAVDFARCIHGHQVRKGTRIPYLSHLLAVSALVLEYGGDEDLAIAGLLHDSIEDGGARVEGDIRLAFGSRIADIVVGCSDATAEAKRATADERLADWRRRKLAYLSHLEFASPDILLVSACDKLHNVRNINEDFQKMGSDIFERFTAKREGTLGYYHSIATIFSRLGAPPAAALAREVDKMHKLAGADAKSLEELEYQAGGTNFSR